MAGAQPERDTKRVALGAGEPLQAIEHWRAQLLKRCERQLHLRLHARHTHHAKPTRQVDGRLKQHCLPNARFAPYHQDAALPAACARKTPVKHLALAVPVEQPIDKVRSSKHLPT
jgi:hypothetical protein